MSDVVIVDAVRSPIGRRGGGLSTIHSADLLAAVLKELVDRSGIEGTEVGQVIGGCVSQVGMQGFNITRTAWLSAGLPVSVAATTIDSQCGSAQQATNLATSLVSSGVVDVAVARGVEVMSRIPIGSSLGQGLGKAIPKSYFARYEWTTQFEGAERIADKWGISREEADCFGVESQQRAAQAWA
jgi:acetyl-CoA C-acetyltransferase